MYFLAAGLVIFFGIHVVAATQFRDFLIVRVGLARYRGVFALLALAGFGLIVFGKWQAEFVIVWQPPYWTRHLVMAVMPFALLSLAMPDIRNNFVRFVRHPMMTGILIWSGAHLTANGDLASVMLFGSFFSYSVFSMIPGNQHKTYSRPPKVPYRYDFLIIIAALVGYAVILRFHQYVSGVPLF